MSTIENYLREIELFDNFPPKTLQAIAAICQKKRINRKEILFTEGDPGRAVYYCIKGYIQLYKSDEKGRESVYRCSDQKATIPGGENQIADRN